MSRLRVQFIHGLESSPQSTKALLLAEHFEALTPTMNTRDFESCVKIQHETIERFQPEVLVGSSFGAAVAVKLLQRKLWRGPTLLLAQAANHLGFEPWLPKGVAIWIVHGLRDDLVDPEDSRVLASSGSPEQVRLIEVDDDHPLRESVAAGHLVAWVKGVAAQA